MKRFLTIVPCFCLLALCGCSGSHSYDTVLVVLGNEPLDENTPTVDMLARTKRVAAYYKEHTNSLLILTGGTTVGNVSEAQMMASLIAAEGVPTNSLLLEEAARTTYKNAQFTAEIMRSVRCRRVLVVSKPDHLEWAMPEFRKYPVFANAEPLPCDVTRSEIAAQMAKYLESHPDNTRVRARLGALLQEKHGAD